MNMVHLLVPGNKEVIQKNGKELSEKNIDQAEISEEDRIKAYFNIILSQMDYKSFNKSIKPELHSAINKLVK